MRVNGPDDVFLLEIVEAGTRRLDRVWQWCIAGVTADFSSQADKADEMPQETGSGARSERSRGQVLGVEAVVAAAVVGMGMTAVSAQQYSVLALGPPAGAVSYSANRMSSDGRWVAGTATFAGGVTQPVVWHDAVPEVIPNLSGTAGAAFDVNIAGLVVGQSNNRGFAYQSGTLAKLAARPNLASTATAVNDGGVIVGRSFFASDGTNNNATLWGSPAGQAVNLRPSAHLLPGSLATEVSNGGVVGGVTSYAAGCS